MGAFESDHFTISRMSGPRTLVVQICPWPGRRPIDCHYDTLELCDPPKGVPEWTDAWRADQAKWVPRKIDGKWVSPDAPWPDVMD
jgi:hypothetical protein